MNTMSATLGASLKRDLFLTRARNYPTCLAMSLDADSIPPEVVTSLIRAVNTNLAPLHKWTKIRKRILGYDTLYTYDLDVPLTSGEQREYPYEEAKKIALSGLRPLGEDYLKEFHKGLEGGWVDVYETQGKESGAFQWGTYGKHPYLLLNYNNTLENVFSLAHEMGHALHSVYTDRSEPYTYRWHSPFTAEVASTTNEALLMKHLLKNAKTKKEKMDLLTTYIEQIIGTFYTQVWFTEFELAIHDRVEKGEATSPEFFRKTWRAVYQKYWGPDLVIDSLNDMGCLRIDHFYRPYYTYKYATSYAAAQMLSQDLLEGKKGAAEKYRRFLSTGSSKYPLAILRDAGVDLTKPEPYQRTITLFGELVDEMEKLLNE
jgi:oligoendopeptidase F